MATNFLGCKKEDAKNSEGINQEQIIDQKDNNIPITQNGDQTNSADEEVIALKYEYEQELNILSDNYRNFYEIFVLSFYDSDGDGVGDIKGIISKLDYIQEMGFNGIWLMPIMPSPSYHKYDVTDYYRIDPQYGTLEDFQQLLSECEERDIKLIIDFVFNHTSAKHPWFTEAVKYLETLEAGEKPDPTKCPSVEYYHFTKEYNGSKDYHKAGTSEWYYEGVFWDQMPDLALENKGLRTEIEKIAQYWMDMGVDGFRLDAVKEFYSGETERNVEVLQWFNDYVKETNPDIFVIGEAWDVKSTIADFYKSGITSLFNFPLALYNGLITSTTRRLGTSTPESFTKTIVSLDKAYRESNPDYIDSPFISNHDTTRISAQCVNDPKLMKMAAGILMTMNGSPFVYYGEEIGMNSKGDKDENKRLPMQWSVSDRTGMTIGPKGADKVEQKFAPVDEQLADPLSILNYYKRAVRIRNENPEIARGEISAIEELTSKEICALRKDYEGSQIIIIYNINEGNAKVDLAAAGYDNVSIRGYLTVDGNEVTLVNGVLEMPLFSIVILK
jgi:glycosidase